MKMLTLSGKNIHEVVSLKKKSNETIAMWRSSRAFIQLAIK